MTKLREKLNQNPKIYLFMAVVALHALAAGFSDSIYANYYKDVYNVSAMQRAFIEFPRELPGVLCSLVIAALSFLGDIRLALIAQILACFGLTVLGLFTPSFSVMLIFLFINSLGMHMYMPLADSIGMALAEPDKVGRRVGQYASIKTTCAFISGIIVFIGFRTGVFTFAGKVKPVFLIGVGFLILAAIAAAMLSAMVDEKNMVKSKASGNKFKLILRKEYKYYYMLTVLTGIQKQITSVFGAWVIIDLLLKGTDVTSLLIMTSSFIGIIFYRQLGKWMDRFGIKTMLYADALSYIIIYTLYGFVVWAVAEHLIPADSWKVVIVYAMFVLDRMSYQMTIVKSVYLKSVAVSPDEVTAALSSGISLDHMISVIASQLCGFVWTAFGPQWVFFFAAFVSLGNLYVAHKVRKKG